MNRALRIAALALAVPVLGPVAGGAADARPELSKEILDLDCRSDLGWRQVTLFANGTIRLRTATSGDREPRMDLGELPPDRLRGFVNRLGAVDLSEVDLPPAGVVDGAVEGDWVETCRLRLELPGRAPALVEYGRYETPPLPVSRLAAIAEEIAALAVRSATALPLGYVPRPGDVLRRVDDVVFEVIDFTSDGKGVELQGVEQPLTLYLRPEDLREQFVELVSRRGE